MIRRYVYGPGIDEPVCMKTTAATYFYHFNALGSVIALSNDTGGIAETYAYSPYGKTNQVSNVGNPYLFTGRRYDPETGLYYYRARYYDSGIGRFLQVDPIEYAGGINLYAYCLNNPLLFVDPWGLCADSIGEKIQRQVQWQLQAGGLGKYPGELVHYTPPTPAESQIIAAYAGFVAGNITGNPKIDVWVYYGVNTGLNMTNEGSISDPFSRTGIEWI